MTLCITGVLLGAAPALAVEGGKTFFEINPLESNIQSMEDAERGSWQKPEQVVERLAIAPGSTVADIGSGTGYFTVLFSKKVGKTGLVYAVDVDPQMVSYLEQRRAKEHLANVRNLLSPPDDPRLPAASIDLAFMCNTYLFIDQRDRYLAKVNAALKRQGRLAIVSYNKTDTPEGPPVHVRISREATIKEVERAGFRLSAEYSFLPYQHFLLFEKR